MTPTRAKTTARVAAALLLAVLLLVGWGLKRQAVDSSARAALAHRLDLRVAAGSQPRLDCATLATQKPLVLLALGQSNAGNHGATTRVGQAPITVVAQGQCLQASDPLPGATGSGASIWSRLPAALLAAGAKQPVVISVLSVDATQIDDWVRQASPLRQELQTVIAQLHQMGLPPTLILWQQGEADARLATTSEKYAKSLTALASTIRAQNATAPVLLARSTACRSQPAERLHAAQDMARAKDSQLRPGPDIDALISDRYRHDGCHLSTEGLDLAAQAWAGSILQELSSISLGRPIS